MLLNWHLVLLKNGELLMDGRNLGLQAGQVMLQGIHELQTDPQFLQRLGRAAYSKARQRAQLRRQGRTCSPHPRLAPPPILLCILLQVGVQLQEAPGCHLLEQSRELVLPLVAVLHQRELEIRAVQQHKLDVEDGLLLLHIISNLCVAERAHIRAGTCFFL